MPGLGESGDAGVLMVICGAGASWDSANFDPGVHIRQQWQPPIGSQLFANRDYFGSFIDRYEEMRPLVHRFRGAANSVALESELEQLLAASTNRELLRRQLTALRYYLQRVITESCQMWSNNLHGVTNYVRLVDEIDGAWVDVRKKSACYVTFNYDVLLDGALGQIGVQVGGDLDSYVSNPRHKLIKPHGSVNWFHPVAGVNPNRHPYSRQIIQGIDHMRVSADFVVAPEQSDIDNFEALPALSIPVARKTLFEMPQRHIDDVTAFIPFVTHLLVIGWRGNEEPFRKLLNGLDRERLVTLVVAGDSASAIQVAKTLGLAEEKPAISDGGFTALVNGSELVDFLRR
jgi:hypothetical protein